MDGKDASGVLIGWLPDEHPASANQKRIKEDAYEAKRLAAKRTINRFTRLASNAGVPKSG